MPDLPALRARLDAARARLNLPVKKSRLAALREKISAEDFWAGEEAPGIAREAGALEALVKKWDGFAAELATIAEFAADPGLAAEVAAGAETLEKKLTDAETDLFFAGKFDENDAVLEIQAGTGGTDAQDFAEMMLRLYLRGIERLGLAVKILETDPATDAGIKSAALEVRGPRAYGLLRREAGVHRLIRLSPFNAKNLRQTGFASVGVTPVVPDAEFHLDEKDLRIDVFRSSGKGGQSVNTTDSAVRITHLPSGLAVSCQNERSQLQNKAAAMALLRGKLAARAEADRAAELGAARGEKSSVGFGSQIRTVTLHPYQLVKDHRSGWETSQTEKWLGGELLSEAIDAAARAGF